MGAIGVSITLAYAVMNGLGIRVAEVTGPELKTVRKAAYFIQIFYTISVSFSKFSLLFLVLRLTASHRMIMICKVIIGITAVYTVVAIGLSVFLCYEKDLTYNTALLMELLDGRAKCVKLGAQQYLAPVINTLTDLVVWIMPIKLVWSLHIPKRQKWGLYGVFGVGFACCFVSAFRIVAVGWFVGGSDPTWEGYTIALCSILEADLALICSCIPSLKPLIIKILPESFLGVVKSKNFSGNHALEAVPPNPATNQRHQNLQSGGLSTINSTESSLSTPNPPNIAGGQDTTSSNIYLPDSHFGQMKREKKGRSRNLTKESSESIEEWSGKNYSEQTITHHTDDSTNDRIANTADIEHQLDDHGSSDIAEIRDIHLQPNSPLGITRKLVPAPSYSSSTEKLGTAAAPFGGHEEGNR
ncbi:hypothetical protein DFH27DRAFT_520774 [Peziza echinospora]|nr:hypothetical protein DFH27DRAFT_520774 [Peziza echinospora]